MFARFEDVIIPLSKIALIGKDPDDENKIRIFLQDVSVPDQESGRSLKVNWISFEMTVDEAYLAISNAAPYRR